MTTQRTLKKQIRDRMKRNSERYTTARAHVLAGRARPKDSPNHFTGGQQGDVAAATNALNAAGVSGPNGQSLTEAQVFGLSGGVGFLYGVFRYDTGPTLTITARNTSMPDTFLDQLWSIDDLNATVHTTGGAKKAAADLQRALDANSRALCSVGAGALGYLGLPEELSAMFPLVVGVVGVDGDDVLIDDRAVEPHRVPMAAFQQARKVLRSAKHRMVTIGEASSIDWQTAVPEAIANGATRYNTPPVKQFESNVGIAGLTKWHRLLTDDRDRMGWPKVFTDGPHAAVGFSRLYQCIEHDYTAPAAGRPLQAEFLRWASELLSETRFADAADLFEQSAERWSAISEAAANADPSVADIAANLDQAAELLGDGTPAQLQDLYEKRSQLVDDSKLSAADARECSAQIATDVAGIIELESAAIALLSHNPAQPMDAVSDTASIARRAAGRSKPTDDERVTMLNPNTGRSDKTISRSIYDPVKAAILQSIEEIYGLRFSDLSEQVESRTGPDLWKKNKVGWYTTSVKLDLEARGLIERFSSPQKLRITDAGRKARGGN